MTNTVQRCDAIAYQYTPGKLPCVIFCAGFKSTMQGTKALALEQYCQQQGQAFIRFDYQGHGDSDGQFADGRISTWLDDTLTVIDRVAPSGAVLLVGSSMGGWLALLAALRRQERVTGLLLLACAADMTRYYPQRLAGLPTQTDAQGRLFYRVPNQYDDQQPYAIYQHLLDDGEQYQLLDQAIDLTIPVVLIHGMNDDVVPWQRSQRVLQQLRSSQVTLQILKDGDHRLSSPPDLALLQQTLALLLHRMRCG